MDRPAEWSRTGSIDADAVASLPDWLGGAAAAVPGVAADDLVRFLPPHGQGRHSAVLVLFGADRDLLLIRRATTMRSHAGQPAFPGGRLDAGDADAAAAALREAREETGLDPSGVDVFGALPDLWVPISNNVVTPVLGWWREPSPVSVQDPAEVASVHRVQIDALADPANRVRVLHPGGYVGPGFVVDGMIVWGFTGGVVSGLLDEFGWSRPWDTTRTVPLPASTPAP